MNSSTILVAFSTREGGGQPTSPSVSSSSNDTYAGPPPPGPPYSVELIVLFLILVMFFVLGVVGNALAFYIYYQKKDKTTSTLFILSLAATDFLTCLIVIPYTLAAEMLKFWLVYDLVCKGYMFCLTFNIPLSAFIMVAVGFDRYFCICHPFLHAMTVRRAKICLVCLTLLACLLGMVTALGYGVYYIETVHEETVVETNSSAAGVLVSAMTTESSAVSAYNVLNTSLVSGGVSSLESTSIVNSVSVRSAEDVEGTESTGNFTTRVIYFGLCVPNTLIVSEHFVEIYQKVYAATFLFSFLIIALLYALIYRSILIRRAWKAKRKRMSCYNSTITAGPEIIAEETQLTNINNGNTAAAADASAGRVSTRTSVALRDRMLYANIKTAAMLFVVTVVFIISFLPSWLIGLGAMPTYYILFYMFFFNNVANPIIYAFMNRTFRDDLRQLLRRIKNRLSGW